MHSHRQVGEVEKYTNGRDIDLPEKKIYINYIIRFYALIISL